jgi:secreted trypsin-like serine protease
MIRVAVILILGLAAVQALKETDPFVNRRIVGGSKAEFRTFPFQVGIALKGYKGTFCGGSKIGSYWVVTAAHCFQDSKTGKVDQKDLAITQILSGTADIKDARTKRSHVDKLLLPTGPGAYNTTSKQNDIVVIKTKDPVAGQSVRLARPGKSYVVYTSYVSGFGTTSEGGSQSEEMLYTVGKILPDSDCRMYASYDPKTMICAGDLAGGKDSCQGDSGGS